MKKPCIIIYTPQEYNHASYIHTGLFELAKKGIIEVKVKLYTKKNIGHYKVDENEGFISINKSFPKVSFYKVIDYKSRTSFKFAVDLYDLADRFPKIALETCDYIFKRHYRAEFVNQLPELYQKKIYKLGLSFPLKSYKSRQNNLMFLGLIVNTIKLNFKWDRYLFKRMSQAVKISNKEWRYLKFDRPLSKFESYEIPKSRTILFQTRCFPHEYEDDVKRIHKERYQIIKLLKTEFPENFKGGFVPSVISSKKFADALTNVPTQQEEYLNAVKNSGIVIYTQGLSNSPAWKMAEYLSQGKVIIAQRLTAELPVPLIHDKHLLFFDNLDELVRLVNLVLDDDKRKAKLSKNARMYFEKNVHPCKNIERMLDVMLTDLKV